MAVRLNHWIGAGENAPQTLRDPDDQDGDGFLTTPPAGDFDDAQHEQAKALAQAAAWLARAHGPRPVSVTAAFDASGATVKISLA